MSHRSDEKGARSTAARLLNSRIRFERLFYGSPCQAALYLTRRLFSSFSRFGAAADSSGRGRAGVAAARRGLWLWEGISVKREGGAGPERPVPVVLWQTAGAPHYDFDRGTV